MKSISVIANARLQSTRVPLKLVRPFAETSLLEIALEKLDRMSFFDHRYLAVAEEELVSRGRRFPNVEILSRRPEAVQRGINEQRVTFAHYCQVPSDYIFVFNPCLPFVSIDTVRKAFDYFQRTNYSSYTSVIRTGDWVFDSDGNPVTNRDTQNLTTNKNVQFYKAAHAFHIVTKHVFAENGIHWTFTKDDPHLVEIAEEECVDVDTELEFELAELLYRKAHW